MNDNNSMPSLQTDISEEVVYDYGSCDLVKFRHCSILAQIEIASCFRNDVEPLFPLLSRFLSGSINPYVFAEILCWS